MKIVNRFTGKLIIEVAELRGADLSDTNLRGADLSGVNLRGADLSDTNLRGADLSGANLSFTELRGADLSGADLSDTNLRGADLNGADLSDANLIVGGHRSDGYRFLAYNIYGVIMIRAGCRYASLEMSRLYWSDENYHNTKKLAAESLALCDHLETMAKIEGWVT